uniref:Nanos C2HC-type zinc finger 1 n=1 Tax=Apteryx owenii TaxID=8824 RepID=A0A8B9SD55_APTOW
MEAFPGGKLEQHRHLPPGERLPGARYGARGHSGCGNVFNSWNDYLGLATLITKAMGPGKGFGAEPPSVVVAAAVPPPEEEEEEEEEAEALQVCVFCRNNKEAVALYTTHILKGPDGRVLCPVLRRYTCPLCGASGDNAHTIKYCPLSKMQAAKQLKHARTALGKKVPAGHSGGGGKGST